MRFYKPNLDLYVVIVHYVQFVTAVFLLYVYVYDFCTQLRFTTVF